MPIQGQGWEIWVQRLREQASAGKSRTIGSYAIYHDGAATLLTGTTAECTGPSSTIEGSGERIVANRYKLATQDGEHYVTFGYIIDDDPDVTPKPGLLVEGTAPRQGVLIHPGHDFVASIGCINLTPALPDATVDIDFVDSRGRIIDVIDDLKSYFGDNFPHENGQEITNAWLIVDEAPD